MYAILSLGIAFDYLHYCYYNQALTAQLAKLSGVFMPKMHQTRQFQRWRACALNFNQQCDISPRLKPWASQSRD